MHHRRTVGLDIPCQVARLQSLTPLLQAPEYRHRARATPSRVQPTVPLEVQGRRRTAQKPAVWTRRLHVGEDAPEEIQKTISGVPVESALDFFLLIGGQVARLLLSDVGGEGVAASGCAKSKVATVARLWPAAL